MSFGFEIAINPFVELGLIIILATILGSVARMLKQPLILAYIFAGVLIGPAFLNVVSSTENVEALSQVGVAFLLFLVGLNLNTVVMREVGKISLIAGVAQVAFTSVVGYFMSIALGFAPLESMFIAIALTFSSTIIIIKLLGDNRDLDSLYGKISIGFLLVQDVIAIFILIFLAGLGTGASPLAALPITFLKASILIGLALLSGKIITPFVFPKAARLSQELLFLAAIAWMFLLTILSMFMGLSLEIGAFLAGVGLASLPFVHDLQSRIRPLRDFFIVLFFIHLGTGISIATVQSVMVPGILLSLFVLIGNPLIVMLIMRHFGYTKRTGLFTGLTVSQISEFSLIIVAMGFALGQVSAAVVGLVTLVGVITITISTYMITYNKEIYERIKNYIGFFERKRIKEKLDHVSESRYDFVFFGAHRMFSSVMEHIPKRKWKRILIIDYDPRILKKWKREGIDVLYGDIEDSDILDKVAELRPKAVFSSVSDVHADMRAMKELRSRKIKYISTAVNSDDALWLYKEGAEYVIVPRLLGGDRAFDIMELLEKKSNMQKVRKDHISDLKRLMR